MAKTNYRKLTEESINLVGAGIDNNTPEFEAAVKYLTEYWEIAGDKQAAKDAELSLKEYKLTSIGNGILDGVHMDYMVEEDQKEQVIVEVNQDEVKQALKALTTRENDFLSYLYDMHAEYNELYFFGQLSHPFITIEKMSNKTLGNYTHGQDAMGITNHIRFNRNFIALNQGENNEDPTRILETLRHEMIHQWQDEVLYMREGIAAKQVSLPVGFGSFLDKNTPSIIKRAKSGAPIGDMMDQKPRPKEWHNRDFKEYAVVVDIPAKGDKCYGNPANMPEGKSYNRKFTCACIASNDAPLTIWSTREVKAHCIVCDQDFIEQKKETGGTIQVVQSHVEAPGEDAIEKKMRNKGYAHFDKFDNKKKRDAFVEELYTASGKEALEAEQGFYLKGNNAYKEGFTHWVAYNEEKPKAKKDALPKKKPAAKKPEVKPVPSEEPVVVAAPPVDTPAKKLDTKEKPKARPAKKPKTPKPVAVEPVVETPVEAPEKEEPMKTDNVIQLPTNEPKTHTSAEDLLAVYKETGSIKGVAEYFGMTPSNIIYHAKKRGVDFKKGVILDAVKS